MGVSVSDNLSGTPVPQQDLSNIQLSGTPVPASELDNIQILGASTGAGAGAAARPPTTTPPGGAAPTGTRPSGGEPSILGAVGGAAKDVGGALETFGKNTIKENVKAGKSSAGEIFRIGSRLAQSGLEMPESFIDHLIGNDMALRDDLYEAQHYIDNKEPVPSMLQQRIATQMKIHGVVYYASEALREFTDSHVSPPASTLGKYGEGIATFLAGLALPIPTPEKAAGLESAEPKFTGSSDAERTLAILRAKGYKILPGDMEAHLRTPKTRIGRALQNIGASRGYAVSLDNIERAERDINVMFGREEDLPLDETNLEEIRAQAGDAYDAVRALHDMSPDKGLKEEAQNLGSEVLDMRLKGFKTPFSKEDYGAVANLRSDLNRPIYSGHDIDILLKSLRRTAADKLRPGLTNKDQYIGSLYRDAAASIERFLGREAGRQGHSDLAEQLKAARRTIAQTYDVQGALEGGRVSPRRLAALRRMRRGRALDPTLDTIAQGYNFAPRSFQPATKAGLPEGRQYMFSWALWGLLRGDPRLMTVYLAEHGARKLSEGDALQLKPEEITRAMAQAQGELPTEAAKEARNKVDEARRHKEALATLKALMGAQAEEGSSNAQQ
jgi:hypothetical protein